MVISEDMRALVCDLGCARMVAASLSLAKISSHMKGTFRFLAPELVISEERVKQTEATDIWAFGMTLYVSSALRRPPVGD